MITFVCGQLCSGKTHYSKALASLVDGVFIEVGDIVREIKNTTDRKKLQDSKELYESIIEMLIQQMPSCNTKQYIVSGVRQKEILDYFPEATILWIDCPKKERKERYKLRSREGDSLSFKEAEQGDIDLGILEVKQHILNR